MVYHVAIPIEAALFMVQQGDNYFKDDPEKHMKAMSLLQSKGKKHYSLCPNITKEGLCGCREQQRDTITP